MFSCGRIFEWVGFCSTCGAKRKSAWLLHSREHLLSPVQDVEDPRSLQWTERQFWFTVAMMCVIFECSADTIRRRVETLVNTGDIDETQNCVSLTNVQAFGYNTTTLYNLNVQIVWASFLSMLFAFGLIIGSSTIINRKRKGDSVSASESPVVIQNGSGMTK